MGLRESALLRNLDKTFAIAGVFFSLILIAFTIGNIGRLLFLLAGVLTFIFSSLWLVIQRSPTFKLQLSESNTQTSIFAIVFFGLLTLSILIVYSRPDIYERPFIYFILIAFMAGIVACEVFSSGKQHVGLILTQILLLGVSIAWSIILIFPSQIGIDPWYHSALTDRIIDEGFIPDGYSYSKMPFFHLVIASESLVTGLPYKTATMLSVSLGQIICNALSIFLITNCLFKNYRIGLLAALMVIIAPEHITMSYASIPNAYAVIFIPFVIYLLYLRGERQNHEKKNLSTTLIIFLLMASIILSHSISAIMMVLLLFVSWGAHIFYRSLYDRTISLMTLSLPVLFTISMFAWWSYASGHIGTFAKLISWGFNVDIFRGTLPEGVNYVTSIPINELLLSNLGIYLFFTVSLIGIFYMISKKGSASTFTIAWAGIAPLAITFITTVSGLSIIESRWWYLAQIMLSVPLAVAIYIIGTWKSKRLLHLNTIVSMFVIIICFLSITCPSTNMDNNTLSPNTSYRLAFTESELNSINAISMIYSGQIGTEEYLTHVLSFSYADINLTSIDEDILHGNYTEININNILIREVIKNDTFRLYRSSYQLNYNLDQRLMEQNYSRTYVSNSVTMYSRV